LAQGGNKNPNCRQVNETEVSEANPWVREQAGGFWVLELDG